MATAMLKAKVGDVVTLQTPRGPERIEIVAIRYDAFDSTRQTSLGQD